MEIINITKTSGGILSTLGIIKKKENIVFQVSEDGLNYNSTLGNIGLIKTSDIKSVELGNAQRSTVIQIELEAEYDLKSKINKFQQKLSELYKKETGAEILIFPQDADMELNELNNLIKGKLKK